MPAPAHGHLLPSAFQEGRGLRPEWAGVELLFASVLGAGVPGASTGAGAEQGAGLATLSSAVPCASPPLPVPHRKPSGIPFPVALLCALPRTRTRRCQLRTWITAAREGPGGDVGVFLSSLAPKGTGSLRPAATHLKGRGESGQKPAAGGGCSWV